MKIIFSSGVQWDPIFFELSSLWKLQNFVAHHKVEENRYLSSPDLMSFKENTSDDDVIEDDFDGLKMQEYQKENLSVKQEDEELIDIESISYGCVTSTTDKVKSNSLCLILRILYL